MAKPRAEIQRAYRQRLKEKNNKQYLAKERARRKRAYVPNNKLPKKKRAERNKKNREYLKIYRTKKKEAAALLQVPPDDAGHHSEQGNTSGYETATPEGPNQMIVRINFAQRANGPKMRISRELKRVLKLLQSNYEHLKRKYRSSMRFIQRQKRTAKRSPLTPRSKATHLTEDLKLTPEQSRKVQKELVFSNALCEEIKSSARKALIKSKRILKNLVAGDIMKKYKPLKRFGAKTGLYRNSLAKVCSKSFNVKNIRRSREIAKNKDKVVTFLERDDNSRNMPGKSDCVKSTTDGKVQKRVLTDYLATLYKKFISENPGVSLSLASFCRIRPQHILLTSLITRDICLCTKHQNMSLTMKALKRQNIEAPLNGEKMLRDQVNGT